MSIEENHSSILNDDENGVRVFVIDKSSTAANNI